ncbi:MAG: hypothetical protein JXJ22_05785 [Bacteroidales bacterium]|nr:hypothetical protein [Bacteroidales bacterium]
MFFFSLSGSVFVYFIYLALIAVYIVFGINKASLKQLFSLNEDSTQHEIIYELPQTDQVAVADFYSASENDTPPKFYYHLFDFNFFTVKLCLTNKEIPLLNKFIFVRLQFFIVSILHRGPPVI